MRLFHSVTIAIAICVPSWATAEPDQQLVDDLPGYSHSLRGGMVSDGRAYEHIAGMLHSDVENYAYDQALELLCVQLHLKPDPMEPRAKLVPQEKDLDWDLCRDYLEKIVASYESLYEANIQATERLLCTDLDRRPRGDAIFAQYEILKDVKAGNARRHYQHYLAYLKPPFRQKFIEMLDSSKQGATIHVTDMKTSWEAAGVDKNMHLDGYCDKLRLSPKDGGGL